MRIFLFFGFKRGGNHGVIHWLCMQGAKSMHVNNCNINNINGYKTAYLYNDGKRVSEKAEIKKNLDASFIIFSFEDADVRERYARWNRSKYWPEHETTYLILMRDIFNLGATRTKFKGKQFGGQLKKKTILRFYKENLKLCLGIEPLKNTTTVDINYNLWFSDKLYRALLCDRLDIPFTDSGLNAIPPMKGNIGKSAWDKSDRFDGRAQDMDVLNRWKNMPIIDIDKEMASLVKAYFGLYVMKKKVCNV
jgi:hypothetical protein